MHRIPRLHRPKRHVPEATELRLPALRIARLPCEHGNAPPHASGSPLECGDDAGDEHKKEIPPAVWPLVDTHAGSGRKVLFVGVHARQIIGRPTAEARMLLLDLLEHATRRENVAPAAGR